MRCLCAKYIKSYFLSTHSSHLMIADMYQATFISTICEYIFINTRERYRKCVETYVRRVEIKLYSFHICIWSSINL